jgi:hypothetical protein
VSFGNTIPTELSVADPDAYEQEKYREGTEQQGAVLREHEEKIKQTIADSGRVPRSAAPLGAIKTRAGRTWQDYVQLDNGSS